MEFLGAAGADDRDIDGYRFRDRAAGMQPCVQAEAQLNHDGLPICIANRARSLGSAIGADGDGNCTRHRLPEVVMDNPGSRVARLQVRAQRLQHLHEPFEYGMFLEIAKLTGIKEGSIADRTGFIFDV